MITLDVIHLIKKSIFRHQWVFAILVFILSFNASANNWKELLKNPNRPTISELLDKGPLPSTNPFTPISKDDPKVNYLIQVGPELINELEFAYPNAVWAPLGRDSSLVGDLLEAFYLKLNQRNRVVRLNASSSSFTGGEKMFIGFLKTAGLVNEKGIPIKDFVILDPTSWRIGSQSRTLMSAVYNAIPKELHSKYLSRVSVVALGNTTMNPISPTFNKEAFLSKISVNSNGPSEIASVQSTPGYLPSLSTYGEVVWHDKFTSFTEVGGQVIAPPGTFFPDRAEHVLWEMYEITKRVQDPEFFKRVRDIALNQYKREFLSFHQGQYDQAYKLADVAMSQFSKLDARVFNWYRDQPLFSHENKDLVWSIVLSSHKTYLSDNLYAISRLIDYIKSSELTSNLVNDISTFYPEKSIILSKNLRTYIESLSQDKIVGTLIMLKPLFPEAVHDFVKGNLFSKARSRDDIRALLELKVKLGDAGFTDKEFQSLLLDPKVNLSASDYISMVNGEYFKESGVNQGINEMVSELKRLTLDVEFNSELLVRAKSEDELYFFLNVVNEKIQSDSKFRNIVLDTIYTKNSNLIETIQRSISLYCKSLPAKSRGTIQKINLTLALYPDLYRLEIKKHHLSKIENLEDLLKIFQIQSQLSERVISVDQIAEKALQFIPDFSVNKLRNLYLLASASASGLPGSKEVSYIFSELMNNPLVILASILNVTDVSAFNTLVSELNSQLAKQSLNDKTSNRMFGVMFNEYLKQAEIYSLKLGDIEGSFKLLQNFESSKERVQFVSLFLETSKSAEESIRILSHGILDQSGLEEVVSSHLSTFLTFSPTVEEFNRIIELVQGNLSLHNRIAEAAIRSFRTSKEYRRLVKPITVEPGYLQAVAEFKKRYSTPSKKLAEFFGRLSTLRDSKRDRIKRASLETTLPIWKVKVAAAEALIEDQPYLRLNSRHSVKRHLQELAKAEHDRDVTQEFQPVFLPKSFYVNLIARSKGIRRQDYPNSEDSNGLIQFEKWLEGQPPSNREAEVSRFIQNQPIPYLTHFDIFKILAQWIPGEDQLRVYSLLAPLVFTRVDFYPQSAFEEFKKMISKEAIAQINEDSRAKKSFVGQSQSASFLGSGWIDPRYLINQLMAQVNEADGLASEQLIELLRKVPTIPVEPNSEDLVPLRNDLRKFTHNKEWTASDLVHMGVSLNVALALKIVKKLIDQGQKSATSHDLKNLVHEVVHRSNIHNIDMNADKKHLKKPIDRKVTKEDLDIYIQNQLIQAT